MFGDGFKNIQSRDFIWLGEYLDGTNISEYNPRTGKESYFGNIDKSKLLRFGIVGHGVTFHVEVFSGKFILMGREYEFSVIDKRNGTETKISGNSVKYNDVIAYKDGYSDLDVSLGRGLVRGSDVGNVVISQYNFGYKTRIPCDGGHMLVKVLCHVPNNKPVFFEIRIVAPTSINGVMRITKNGSYLYEREIDIDRGEGKSIVWRVL